MALLRVALRYLAGHARRYVFVLIVLALGFGFITVASSLADGMEEAVTNAALRHYAGHLFVIGRDKQGGNKMAVDDPQVVEEAVEAAGVPVERIVRRTHEHLGAEVFFHGDAVRLKDVFGVDFAAEADLFRGFDYVEGSFDPDWEPDTIVVSEPTAERLDVRRGDDVVMRLETRREQMETRTFTVRAIVADSSIYGYARAYTDREALAEMMDLSPASYSAVGIFIEEPAEAGRWARELYGELAEGLPVAERIETKETLTREIRRRWEGVRYFVFALPVYISEVTDLLEAMQLGSYLLLSMIVLVVLAAVVVTYRVVLHDRRREIGTMLAVGFTRPRVAGVLLTEAVMLLCAGMAAGLLISLGVTAAVSTLSFEWIPGFEIFMQGGRLTASYTAVTVGRNVALILGVVLPVIALMVWSTVRRSIPALTGGETV
ncbi:MAG: ABC transporter permease [Spirochaetaceae bacterium]